jgi:hypothetical protein
VLITILGAFIVGVLVGIVLELIFASAAALRSWYDR